GSDGRCLRPGAGLHRAGDGAAATLVPGLAGGIRACDHRRRGPVRPGGIWSDRGHHHAAAPAVQPQRDLFRRPAAPLVLPARAEAGTPSARAGRGGHQRRRALLPGHRQRAASGASQGTCRGVRGLLHGAPCARTLCERLRGAGSARPVRGVREFQRRRFLRPAAQRGAGRARARGLGPAGIPALRRRHHRAARGGRDPAVAAAPTLGGRFCRGTAPGVIRIDVAAVDRGLAGAPWGGDIHAAWRRLAPACTADGVPLAALDALAREGALRSGRGLALRFVAADSVRFDAYEAHIAGTGEVPTRTAGPAGLHDLLNALAWLAWPLTKARLNAVQAAVIEHDGIAGRGGAVRDAATVFDENAAVLVTDDEELVAALRARD